MKNEALALLYINHVIQPLEQLIKDPHFVEKLSETEQIKINQLLLQEYRNIESIIKDD